MRSIVMATVTSFYPTLQMGLASTSAIGRPCQLEGSRSNSSVPNVSSCSPGARDQSQMQPELHTGGYTTEMCMLIAKSGASGFFSMRDMPAE